MKVYLDDFNPGIPNIQSAIIQTGNILQDSRLSSKGSTSGRSNVKLRIEDTGEYVVEKNIAIEWRYLSGTTLIAESTWNPTKVNPYVEELGDYDVEVFVKKNTWLPGNFLLKDPGKIELGTRFSESSKNRLGYASKIGGRYQKLADFVMTIETKITLTKKGDTSGKLYYVWVSWTFGLSEYLNDTGKTYNGKPVYQIDTIFDPDSRLGTIIESNLDEDPDVPECDDDLIKECPDGSSIVVKKCVDGKYVETGNTCPEEEPECMEPVKIKCPDDSEIITHNCINGKLIPTGNKCPEEEPETDKKGILAAIGAFIASILSKC